MVLKEYRPEIDGLRAVAVLSVVLYHAGVGLATGFAGVDIFFVISGYLITWLLLRELQVSGRIDLIAFYARRALRILPAAITVVLATLIFAANFLSEEEKAHTYRSATAGLLFFANIFFLKNSGGYFDAPSDQMPLLHLWSLSVEEQFYVFWPLLLILVARFRPKWFKFTVVLLIATSLLAAEYFLQRIPEQAFFQMPARFWELAIGGLVASLPRRPIQKEYLSLMGICFLIAGLLVPNQHFPGIGALPAVAGTAILLLLLHCNGKITFVGRFLRLPPVLFVGRISYSLYLWHWPLLAIYRAGAPEPALSACLAICVAAFFLAFLSFRYVETPFRKLTNHYSSRKVVTLGFGTSVIAAVTIFLYSSYLPGDSANIANVDDATRAENDLTPYRAGCKLLPLDPPDKFPKADCVSLRGEKPTVAMLGDSYGSAWQPLAWEIANKLHLSAADYSRSGCPAFLSKFGSANLLRDSVCQAFNLEVAKKIKNFDVLVIANRWDVRSLTVNEIGISATLDAEAPNVRKIYVLGPSPVLHATVAKCIRAKQSSACSIERSEFEQKSEETRAMLKLVTATYKNVVYVELSDFFCSQTDCPSTRDGIILYSDASHVSYTAAKKFAQIFAERI